MSDHKPAKSRKSLIKSKKLWLGGLSLVVLYFIFANIANYYIRMNKEKEQPGDVNTQQTLAKTMTDTDIIQSINAERQKVGSAALSYNGSLVNAAISKGNDAKASKDFSPGSSSSIEKYLKDAGYKSNGSTLWVQPVSQSFNSSEFVQWMLGSQGNKNVILDGQFKEIGLSITPINETGVTSLVTIYIAKPYVAPNTVYVPKSTPVYRPPIYNPIHCTSSTYFGTTYTNCY